MELDPVLLSRVQFAFVISFHIIFPAFTIDERLDERR
jgi:cytochrome bd ubiquinol oxidase subunit I